MLKILTRLFLLCVLLSCGSGKKSDILPKAKMEKVLWDVAQSGEFLNNFIYYKYPEQNRAALNSTMLNRIFKIHKITKKQFDATMEYYKEHPKDLQVVLDSITSQQKRLNNTDTTSIEPTKPGAPATL